MDNDTAKTDQDKPQSSSVKRKKVSFLLIIAAIVIAILVFGFIFFHSSDRGARISYDFNTYKDITVQVVDSQNNPISGCEVTVGSTPKFDSAGGGTLEMPVYTTDSDGRITVSNMAVGEGSAYATCIPKDGDTECEEEYDSCVFDYVKSDEVIVNKDHRELHAEAYFDITFNQPNNFTIFMSDWPTESDS